MQSHRKGKHGLLFGVVVPVALDFGKVLPGNIGLLVHGGIFQPPLVNEPQQTGGEALAEVVHQAFQTAGCHGCGCRRRRRALLRRILPVGKHSIFPAFHVFSAPTVKLVAFIVLRYIVVVDVLLHRGEQLAAHRQRVPVVEHQIHGQVVLHDVLRDGVHRNAEGLFFGVAIVPAGQQRESHAFAVVLCG